MSLTDHDTVSGINEFMSEIDNKKIKGIPGVEIAMLYEDREYHILGYWIDHENKELLEFIIKQLETIEKNRNF